MSDSATSTPRPRAFVPVASNRSTLPNSLFRPLSTSLSRSNSRPNSRAGSPIGRPHTPKSPHPSALLGSALVSSVGRSTDIPNWSNHASTWRNRQLWSIPLSSMLDIVRARGLYAEIGRHASGCVAMLLASLYLYSFTPRTPHHQAVPQVPTCKHTMEFISSCPWSTNNFQNIMQNYITPPSATSNTNETIANFLSPLFPSLFVLLFDDMLTLPQSYQPRALRSIDQVILNSIVPQQIIRCMQTHKASIRHQLKASRANKSSSMRPSKVPLKNVEEMEMISSVEDEEERREIDELYEKLFDEKEVLHFQIEENVLSQDDSSYDTRIVVRYVSFDGFASSLVPIRVRQDTHGMWKIIDFYGLAADMQPDSHHAHRSTA